jgi:hypothetical protein
MTTRSLLAVYVENKSRLWVAFEHACGSNALDLSRRGIHLRLLAAQTIALCDADAGIAFFLPRVAETDSPDTSRLLFCDSPEKRPH